MPQQLTKLKVNRVSLVDRAAVRDPANPGEPQTFLLFKRDADDPQALLKQHERDLAHTQAAIKAANEAAAREKAARERAEAERDARLADHTLTPPRKDNDMAPAISPADAHPHLSDEHHAHLLAAHQHLSSCRGVAGTSELARQVDDLLNPDPEVLALSKLDGQVAELRKSDTSLSKEAAVARAMQRDPELRRELAGATRRIAA